MEVSKKNKFLRFIECTLCNGNGRDLHICIANAIHIFPIGNCVHFIMTSLETTALYSCVSHTVRGD